MRSFSFKARNIGDEHYLTYTMGEGTEVDEDVLNYCEENEIKGLVKIIYEEDDDYDYLTYDITGKVSLDKFQQKPLKKEQALKIIRNIALGIIDCKEQAIKISYLLLNRGFIYVDPQTLNVQFICLPVESSASVATEFKGFIRQFIASSQYDIEEDLTYVGQLLTYINGEGFNLRGIIGLSEALMEDAGIEYEVEDDAIATGEGEEVVIVTEQPTESVGSVMDNLGDANAPLPEIGDDEEEDVEDEDVDVADIDAADIPIPAVKAEEPVQEETEKTADEDEGIELEEVKEETEEVVKNNKYSLVADEETDEDDEEDEESQRMAAMDDNAQAAIEARIKALANGEVASKSEAKAKAESDVLKSEKPEMKTKIKINRAAIVQSAAQNTEEAEAAATEEEKTSAEDEVNVSEEGAETETTVTAEPETPEKPVKVTSLTGKEGAIKVNPYLVRVTTEEKTIINKDVFKIGKANRGVDYHISGNGAISRQHAVITKKKDGYYIKDNKSTNHTYVNDKKLEDGEEIKLHKDDIVRFADDEYTFKY